MAPKAYIFSQKPLTRRSAACNVGPMECWPELLPSNAETVVTSHRSPTSRRTPNDCKVSCSWVVLHRASTSGRDYCRSL